MSELYKCIEDLCKEKGITVTQMCKECGASRGSLSDLSNGRIKSLSSKTLLKLACYFNVSIDYLTGASNFKTRGYNWGIILDDDVEEFGAPNTFNAPYDFCKEYVKPEREFQGVQAKKIATAIGLSEDEYLKRESGELPITLEDAQKIAYVLNTTIQKMIISVIIRKAESSPTSSPIFTVNMKGVISNSPAAMKKIGYDDEVSVKYQNNVRKGENLDNKAADLILNPDIRMIARAGQKMTPEQAENLRKYAQFMFPEAFKDVD